MEKVSNTYLVFILIAMMLVGCKKNNTPLVDVIDIPEFEVSGIFDTSDNFNFVAGENNYLMKTDFNKIIDTSRSLVILEGRLENMSCNDCQSSLRIQVSDIQYRDTFSPAFNIDSIFYPGKSFLIQDSTSSVNLFQPNSIIIQYNSGGASFGKFFSSRVSNSTMLNISKVERFIDNEKGQKTIKVWFSTECNVAEAIGQPGVGFMANGTFAFAYP